MGGRGPQPIPQTREVRWTTLCNVQGFFPSFFFTSPNESTNILVLSQVLFNSPHVMIHIIF